MKNVPILLAVSAFFLTTAPLFADTLSPLVRSHFQGNLDASLWPVMPTVFFPTEQSVRLTLEAKEGAVFAVVREVAELGGTVELVEPPFIQAVVPRDQVDQLDGVPGLRHARFPLVVKPLNSYNGEAETTEGLPLIGADRWHEKGLTGKDAHVVVLDVEFGGYESLLGLELPETVEINTDLGQGEGSHGTACAEVVHDMAPDARLTLVSITTEIAYIVAMSTITEEIKPDIVTASIGFSNYGPTDGTGWLAEKVNEAYESGILYVGAAGERGHQLLDRTGQGYKRKRPDGNPGRRRGIYRLFSGGCGDPDPSLERATGGGCPRFRPDLARRRRQRDRRGGQPAKRL